MCHCDGSEIWTSIRFAKALHDNEEGEEDAPAPISLTMDGARMERRRVESAYEERREAVDHSDCRREKETTGEEGEEEVGEVGAVCRGESGMADILSTYERTERTKGRRRSRESRPELEHTSRSCTNASFLAASSPFGGADTVAAVAASDSVLASRAPHASCRKLT